MRIFFAQLCALFLVAITTVAIGAPIENTNTSMVTHLDKRETFPVCNAPYTKLRSASCYGWSQMYVTCVVPRQPSVTNSNLQPCKPNERCVPFSYYDPVGFNLVQNAKCVPDKKRTRDWRSDEENPRKKVCSQRVSYIISGENAHIATGVGTYSPFGNTANVDEIEVYRDGKLYDSITNKCNLSSLITNYNGETIQYCFTTSSVTVVVGIAAATQGDGDN